MAEIMDSIVLEFRSLRKGRGFGAPDLDRRLGPNLRRLAGNTPNNDATDRRRKLAAELTNLATHLAPELQMAAMAGLALSSATKHMSHLKDRIDWLAGQLHVDYRTAHRRVDDGERLLAEQVASALKRLGGTSGEPSHEWYIDELRTLLRLDTATPESHEHRRIVATKDGVTQIVVWLDLPTDRDQPSPSLLVDVLYGGRLVRQEQPTRARFRLILQLPGPLRIGQAHEYGIILRLPPGQPMRPHYIFTPECVCRRFVLRVRFDLNRRPTWVRRVDGETVRSFDEAHLVGAPLTIDNAGEISLEFVEPALYLGYGAQWQP